MEEFEEPGGGMSGKQTRGVQGGEVIRNDALVRDTRNLSAKFFDWLRSPKNMALLLTTLACIAFIYPAICDICLVVALGFTGWGMTRQEELPLKLPALSGLMDPHERHPATGAASKAKGIFFLGNEIKTGREVWLTNSDCRQHFLVLGTTGAGKTEALLGFAANAVTWGSGFLFCDGKGDVSLFAKVYALARRFGREDDLLVLNFMTGNQDIGTAEGKVRSNTLNPFATGSSDTLTQMVVGLMDETGGDGAMWKGRATAMFTGVMRALTWLRDQQKVDLNVAEIRDHLNLKKIIDLADQAKFPDMPQHIRKSIRSYLSSLPGFQEDKGHKQGQTTLDQHGYLEMQFTRILSSLADVYGHIFNTPYGEIDMTDVVLNRRILVVMLPALEKASDEIANLGKIVVATLKGMMGGTLGSEIEGNWYGVVEQRPTTSPTPFVCILDEVGYYMVDGMDLMSAQARSLGFSLVFAGQDINAMKRFNEKVFDSVRGNTNTKIILRTEDTDTMKLAVEAAGKAFRAAVGGYEGRVGELHRSYFDNLDAKIEEVERINSLDLKAQDEGEMHILHKEWLVRAKSFYAAPETSLDRNRLTLRANHFITVAKPNADDIASHQRLPEIVQRLADPEFARQMRMDAENAASDYSSEDEVATLAATTAEVNRSARKPSNPVEIACVAFAKLLLESRKLTESYARNVHASSAMPRDELDLPSDPASRRQPTGPFDQIPGFDGFFDDPSTDGPVRPPDAPTRAIHDYQEDVRQQPPKRPITRPAVRNKLRTDVGHGVKVDDGSIHEMADRISSNDSIMRTLAALDFDAATTTPDRVDNAIEEALGGGDGGSTKKTGAVFDRVSAHRADVASRSAIPDVEEFDDTDADEGGDDESGDAAVDFLEALLLDDDDEGDGQ